MGFLLQDPQVFMLEHWVYVCGLEAWHAWYSCTCWKCVNVSHLIAPAWQVAPCRWMKKRCHRPKKLHKFATEEPRPHATNDHNGEKSARSTMRTATGSVSGRPDTDNERADTNCTAAALLWRPENASRQRFDAGKWTWCENPGSSCFEKNCSSDAK